MISSLLYIFLMEKRNDIGYEIDGEKIYINSLKLVVIGFVIALTSIFLPFFQTESGRYEYTCTFEDYVTVNDITEVYNIISVEDDIWTV